MGHYTAHKIVSKILGDRRSRNQKGSISTVEGEAEYVRTEEEDNHGRWNDSYAIKNGYWVVHEGKKHHVYKTKK